MSFKKDIFCVFKNENTLEQMIEYVGMCMNIQSCLTFCNPLSCNPLSSSVHVIFQARMLEWVAIPFSRGSSWPRDWTQVSCLAADSLLFEPLGKPQVRIKEDKWIKSIPNKGGVKLSFGSCKWKELKETREMEACKIEIFFFQSLTHSSYDANLTRTVFLGLHELCAPFVFQV